MASPAELLHFSRTVSAQYSEFAAIALSFYEWMICFDLEVEHIWKSKLSGVSLLYYLNRYGGMLCGIFVILHIQPWWGQTDQVIIIGFEMATNIIQLLAVAVFAALRVYAVCNRNNWMLAFVLVLVLIHPAITTYTYAELALGVATTPLGTSCSYYPVINPYTFGDWTMGARSSAIFADGLVVAIILFQTIQIRRRLAGHRTKAARLITVFMRDGTMYFAILFVVYVISVGLGRIFEYMDMMMSWISGLSSVLMARFMLELRAIGSGAHDDGYSVPLQTLVFKHGSDATESTAVASDDHHSIAQTSTTGTGSMVFATEGASRPVCSQVDAMGHAV